MSRAWDLWREPYIGVAGGRTMQPCNIEIKLAGSGGHLDQKYGIRLCTVDINDEFREELDRISLDTDEKIVLEFRQYLSDDLETPQATVFLQVESVGFIKGAAAISAVSPRLNMSRTGEVYNNRDIPMLKGFV